MFFIALHVPCGCFGSYSQLCVVFLSLNLEIELRNVLVISAGWLMMWQNVQRNAKHLNWQE